MYITGKSFKDNIEHNRHDNWVLKKCGVFFIFIKEEGFTL